MHINEGALVTDIKLNNKNHRVYIASAIFRAIRDYKEILESNV